MRRRRIGRIGALIGCVALFVLLPAGAAVAGTLTVTLDGAGAGTVTGGTEAEPDALDCSNSGDPGGPGAGACSKNFDLTSASIALEAHPDPGYVFAGWSGSGAGECSSGDEPSCSFTLGPVDAATATATFIPAPDPPIAVTGSTAPGPNAMLIELQGTVDPNGFEVGQCRFEVGPTTAYGLSLPCAPAASELGEGSGPEAVAGLAELELLAPSTTYHYRLVAANLGGAGAGADRTFATGSATADGCANAGFRAAQGFGALLLPGCMALELVSPAQKDGQIAAEPAVSAEGERVRFKSGAALGETPGRTGEADDFYVASRGGGGWQTASTSPPSPLAHGWGSGVAEAMSFSPDFSCWLQIAATMAEIQAGTGRAFRSCLGGAPLTQISPLLDPVGNGMLATVARSWPHGVSADLSRLYFRPGPRTRGTGGQDGEEARYSADDPIPRGSGADRNTYVVGLDDAGSPLLELLARDDADVVWGGSCGTRLGGVDEQSTADVFRNQGALSPDGKRAYFSTRPDQPEGEDCDPSNKLRILKRLETPSGPEIEELLTFECDRVSPACDTTDGDDLYQGASVDGTKVYFTTNRQLADSDLDGGVAATGTGTTSSGSSSVTEVAVSSGSFAVGQTVSGPGIPGGTKITGVASNSLTLSEGATASASGVAFTAVRECSGAVAASGCDLYLYDSELPAGERLIQVSAGDASNPTPGAEAKVYGAIAAISGDGSHVYFAAQGVLTTEPNPEGASADDYPGETPKLYAYQRDGGNPDGSIAFVGALDPGDAASGDNGGLWGRGGTLRNGAYPVPVTGEDPSGAEVGGDGQVLLFQSNAPLTADDGDGTHRDVFRYDAEAGELERVSKADGGDDDGDLDVVARGTESPASIGTGTEFAELGRWASEDGETVVFRTAEALLPGDANGLADSYLWRDGELARLPGTAGGSNSPGRSGPALSHDGAVVAFRSFSRLVWRDRDSAADIYVARAGGGFPEPAPESECDPDGAGGCQGDEAEPPSASPRVSEALIDPGNLRPVRDCRAPARRAQRLSKRAKRLQRNAKRVSGEGRARRLRTKSKRFAKGAQRLSRDARRCRNVNRRMGR